MIGAEKREWIEQMIRRKNKMIYTVISLVVAGAAIAGAWNLTKDSLADFWN